MSPLAGDPVWHVSSHSGEACCNLQQLYPVTLIRELFMVTSIKTDTNHGIVGAKFQLFLTKQSKLGVQYANRQV